MKIETRGKYPGVKIHLDPEECEILVAAATDKTGEIKIATHSGLARKMGKLIKELEEDNPDLLSERTPEQIAAILAKESEKARLQLEALKKGANWKKIEPSKLKSALLAHVEK